MMSNAKLAAHGSAKAEENRGASVNGIVARRTDRTYLEHFDVKETRGIAMNI